MFNPTGTSRLLIDSIKPHIKGGKLLDLGCGSGIVGRSLIKEGLDIYASDIDKDVCLHVGWDEPITSRCGSLFEPWELWKFHYIVDDVSGVAEDLSFPWFKGVPCNSGKDGCSLITEVLIKAPKYLYEDGILFFPIVSLSNQDRILKLANHLYNIVHIGHDEFNLPPELLDKEIPKEYYKIGKFGFKKFWTDIYKATPKE